MLEKINNTYKKLTAIAVILLSIVVFSAFIIPDYFDIKLESSIEWEDTKENEEKDFEEDKEEEKLIESEYSVQINPSFGLIKSKKLYSNNLRLNRPIYDIITPPPEML